MKYFVLGKAQGKPVVLVEWDRATRTLTVQQGSGSIEFNDIDIQEGISGQGIVSWRGKNFLIMQDVHDRFIHEFGEENLIEDYVAADAWATRTKREIKNPYTFMRNWLKRSRHSNKVAI